MNDKAPSNSSWTQRTGNEDIDWNKRYEEDAIARIAAHYDFASPFTLEKDKSRPSMFGEAALAVSAGLSAAFSEAQLEKGGKASELFDVTAAMMKGFNERMVRDLTGADASVVEDSSLRKEVDAVIAKYRRGSPEIDESTAKDAFYAAMHESYKETLTLMKAEALKKSAGQSPAT